MRTLHVERAAGGLLAGRAVRPRRGASRLAAAGLIAACSASPPPRPAVGDVARVPMHVTTPAATFAGAARELQACHGRGGLAGGRKRAEACARILYIESPSMPLSMAGTAEIREAARLLDVPLTVLDAAALGGDVSGDDDAAPGGVAADRSQAGAEAANCLRGGIIAAGGTLHYPAVVAYRDGQPIGNAILGFKTGRAYAGILGERLGVDGSAWDVPDGSAPWPSETGSGVRVEAEGATPQGWNGQAGLATMPADCGHGPPGSRAGLVQELTATDVPLAGTPGAYFRFVHGRNAISYEYDGDTYLIDLATGRTIPTPGFVDFIPSPDGRLFVTPAARNGGLLFYDADAVFAGRAGRAAGPDFRDRAMRDQYPSIGILSSRAAAQPASGRYRVLTSWFDKVRFRDYEVTFADASNGSRLRVEPVADPVIACPELQVSIPMLSPDGRELAGRSERSGRTVIWRLSDTGGCTPVDSLAYGTSKVAWSPDGSRIAFFRAEGPAQGNGILAHDRRTRRLTRIASSAEAHRLAFPDFIGRDSVVFIATGQRGRRSFRIVCCLH